jgi:hypothetical protein
MGGRIAACDAAAALESLVSVSPSATRPGASGPGAAGDEAAGADAAAVETLQGALVAAGAFAALVKVCTRCMFPSAHVGMRTKSLCEVLTVSTESAQRTYRTPERGLRTHTTRTMVSADVCARMWPPL